MNKNASTLIGQVNRGTRLDLDYSFGDLSTNIGHKRYTSLTVKNVAGISSNGAVLRSERNLNLKPRADLVVNRLPDLQLKVPLDQISVAVSEKVESLKKRNLDRFETVSQNLRRNANE